MNQFFVKLCAVQQPVDSVYHPIALWFPVINSVTADSVFLEMIGTLSLAHQHITFTGSLWYMGECTKIEIVTILEVIIIPLKIVMLRISHLNCMQNVKSRHHQGLNLIIIAKWWSTGGSWLESPVLHHLAMIILFFSSSKVVENAHLVATNVQLKLGSTEKLFPPRKNAWCMGSISGDC